MSLEDIDDKFDKIAKGLSNKEKEKTSAEIKNQQKRVTYEENTKKTTLSPLLSIFENHLRSQLSNKSDDSSDEFRTIKLSEKDISQSPSQTQTESDNLQKTDVSEEQIESLLNFAKPPEYSQLKKNTTIESTVYTQTKYEDINPPPNNTASWDDLNISSSQDSNNIAGPENLPSKEDATTGFKPVNVSESYKNKMKKQEDSIAETNSEENSPSIENTDIDEGVLKKINKHREKNKHISEHDGTLKNEQ